MNISKTTRRAYSEVDEFLSLISEENLNKVPQEIKNLFKEEKDKKYVKNIDPNEDIAKQDLMEETLAIIAMLNLKYWCEDEKEKERLIEIYQNNEEKYKDLFQIDFNENEIFRKDKIEVSTDEQKDTDENEKQLTEYSENIFERIMRHIFKVFHIRGK